MVQTTTNTGGITSPIAVAIAGASGRMGQMLIEAVRADSAFALANAVATSWFGDLVFIGSAWAVWYHYLAGLRHLYFDAGHGLDIKTAERLGWGLIIGSVLLTVITIAII